MQKPAKIALLIAALCLLPIQATLAEKPRMLMWDQMIPPQEKLPPPALPGSSPDESVLDPYEEQMGWPYGTEAVQTLNREYVKLPGFIVPLESDEGGLLDEFLLVPYFGACIHVPPPPPNQIVYVRLDEAQEILDIREPYWVIGTMYTKPYNSDVAQAVYQIAAEDVERYEY